MTDKEKVEQLEKSIELLLLMDEFSNDGIELLKQENQKYKQALTEIGYINHSERAMMMIARKALEKE